MTPSSWPSDLSREIAEILLLIDYVSGHPNRQLSSLDGSIIEKDTNLTYPNILERLAEIREKMIQQTNINREDYTFLIKIKDRLNSIAYPAKGSSIAYTSLFGSKARAGGVGTANIAFPEAVDQARRFKRFNSWLAVMTLITAVLATFVFWHLTHGVRLAAQFEAARKDEAAAAARIYVAVDKDRREAASPDAAGRSSSIDNLIRFCKIDSKKIDDLGVRDYKDTTIKINHDIRLLCNEFVYRNALYCVSITDMGIYKSHVLFRTISHLLPSNVSERSNDCVSNWEDVTDAKAKVTSTSSKSEIGNQEDAQTVIAVLNTMINYIMPMLFGFIGASVSLIRNTQDNINRYLLNPRDYVLSITRLILGGLSVSASACSSAQTRRRTSR